MAVFDYEMNQSFAIDYEKMKWEEIRAKMAPYRDPANYRFLREMPCDDVSALVLRDLDIFLNRYEFSSVMRYWVRTSLRYSDVWWCCVPCLPIWDAIIVKRRPCTTAFTKTAWHI